MAFNVSKQITLSLSARSFGTIHQITRSFKFATPLHQQTRSVVNAQASTAELLTSLKKNVASFQIVPNPMERCRQLLCVASKLNPLLSKLHTEEHRVQGFVSHVSVKASLHDGAVQFHVDSHSHVTKGLAAMDGSSQESHRGSPSDDGKSGNGDGPLSETPVEDSIRKKIIEGLNPEQLLIVNESSKHAGHIGNPNNGPETHFKLEIVASKFEGANSVKRHRMVYTLLQEELAGPVHALALNTRTPMETK